MCHVATSQHIIQANQKFRRWIYKKDTQIIKFLLYTNNRLYKNE